MLLPCAFACDVYFLSHDIPCVLYLALLYSDTGTKHFTLGVPVPVIKAIMCRIPGARARAKHRPDCSLTQRTR